MSYLNYLLNAGGREGFRERVWVHHNATLGATVGSAINADPTAFASAEAMLVIDNTASRNSGQNVFVIPVSIDLICTDAGSGAATTSALRLQMDTATSYSSGGTTLSAGLTFFDTRDGYADTSAYARAVFGDVALAVASTSRKNLGIYPWLSGDMAFAIHDVQKFVFGAEPILGRFGTRDTSTVSATGIELIRSLPPVIIGPGCSLIIQPHVSALTAGPDFQISVTCIEVGHPRASV